MSTISKKLQTDIFHGLGAPEPEVGAIPVLFGSRLIKDPQIIYARTTGMPSDPRDIPAVERQPSRKQEANITGTRQWAVVAVLCYGELDKCQGIWCNGSRILARKDDTDTDGDLLLDATNRESNFEDNDFFGEKEPLEGFCFVLPGKSFSAGDLYNRANYLREWRQRLKSRGVSDAFLDRSVLLTPPDGTIRYNGLALAHIYTFEQASESLNSWSFFCTRFASKTWDPDHHKIELLTDTYKVNVGGETRARDHVLAIDCSPINGLPVNLDRAEAPILHNDPGTTSARRGFVRSVLHRWNRRERLRLFTDYFYVYNYRTLDIPISWGIFEYRYDIIRQGAIATLRNFVAKLRESASQVTYGFTLRVLLYRGRFRSRRDVETEIREIRIPTYKDKDGNDVTNTTRNTLFKGDTSDMGTVENFIESMQQAILLHPWLASSPSAADIERAGGNEINLDKSLISRWRNEYLGRNFRSSIYFQNSPKNWDSLWVDPIEWKYPSILGTMNYIRSAQQDRNPKVDEQSQRICWAPINPEYHPRNYLLDKARPTSGLSGWWSYFQRMYLLERPYPGWYDGEAFSPRKFVGGIIAFARVDVILRELKRLYSDIFDDHTLPFEAAMVGAYQNAGWFNAYARAGTGDDRVNLLINLAGSDDHSFRARLENSQYERWIEYCRADLYKVFEYVFKLDEFKDSNLKRERLPQLNIISGPNWPGRLGAMDVPITGGTWSSHNTRTNRSLVGGYLMSTFPTVEDLYHMAAYDDIKSPMSLRFRPEDNVTWGFARKPDSEVINGVTYEGFRAKLKALIAATYTRTPEAPYTSIGVSDGVSNLTYTGGDRKINWDFMMLDPFCWGITTRKSYTEALNYGDSTGRTNFRFDPGSEVDSRRLTANGWMVSDFNDELWDTLRILQENNVNPHSSDDEDYVAYDPFKAGSQTQSRVWPQRDIDDSWPLPESNNGPREYFSRKFMHRIVKNCVASTDTNPGEALGNLGNRMGAVRTKSREESLNQVIEGSNPIHIIRECLLNEEWGGGRGLTIQEDDLNNDSFLTASEILYEEEMGLGFLWDRRTRVEDFIAEVVRHIDGVLYEIGHTIYIKLFGKREEDNVGKHYRNPVAIEDTDFLLASANPFNESNVIAVHDIKTPRESELFNRVVINYQPYGSSVKTNLAFSNEQHISRYGLKAKTMTYNGILDFSVADKIGRRDLAIEEAGLYSCTLEVLPEYAANISPGDLIAVSWELFQIEILYMRVLSISLGSTTSETVRLKCLQAHKGLVVDR